MRNPNIEKERVQSMAAMFDRIAWFLDDHAEMMAGCLDRTDPEWSAGIQKTIDEATELRARVLELKGEWEKRRHFGDGNNAAAIVADMLREWRVPGSVWYLPHARRFRLAGDDYKPAVGEFCVGTYLPDAPIEMLADDFNEALEEEAPAVSKAQP